MQFAEQESLYSIEDLVAATGGRIERVTATSVGSVSIDSREIEKGALFAAIGGERFDGHDFVPQAIEAGAVVAMVSEFRAADFPDLPLLVVPDVLKGLEALARSARARSTAKIVAVTGSAGKTTTKEAIRTVLEGAGATHASIKSFNNHWGVPLMLARLPQSAQFGVFELGMNHPGEIAPLSALVRPHVAVITTVAAAHLEAFGSIEDIARAKAEIFAGLVPGGTALINADHPYVALLQQLAAEAGIGHVLTYGFALGADIRIVEHANDGLVQTARVDVRGTPVSLALNVAGAHMLANAVAALGVAHLFGLDLGMAVERLARFGAPEGRGRIEEIGAPGHRVTVIDESYNANPASMRAALDVFAQRQVESGHKVLVLGDMYELGAKSELLHGELKDAVLAVRADRIYLVGTQMRALADELGADRVTAQAETAAEIAERIAAELANGDVVMVKGSNGVRLGTVVARIREAFAANATP